jgi:hypothetical protein
MDVLTIALAPECDLRYERMFAYLQEDVTRKHATVDFALRLLCDSPVEFMTRRRCFDNDATLVAAGLLRLVADPQQVYPTLLAHFLRIDPQVTKYLLGFTGLDNRLSAFCRLLEVRRSLNEAPIQEHVKHGLREVGGLNGNALGPQLLYFRGPVGSGQLPAAEGIAFEMGTGLIKADLTLAPNDPEALRASLAALVRECTLRDYLLVVVGLDGFRTAERRQAYRILQSALAWSGANVVLCGEQPWTSASGDTVEPIEIEFEGSTFSNRRQCWENSLNDRQVIADAADVETLAAQFRLSPEQIASSVAGARSRAQWRSAAHESENNNQTQPIRASRADLFAGARAQSGRWLSNLAIRINPLYDWDDIVLPPDTLLQLREISQRVAHRPRVFEEWGFDRKISYGKGVNVLFAGGSGCGKTMSAEILAHDLGLQLLKVDLSGVVSKWLGETELHIRRLFEAARDSNSILFFDEADALFGKRSEVHDSHDRYANIEISFLLQQIEQYDSVISILASNLSKSIDEAFLRRLTSTIHFPFPDTDGRLRIWNKVWPSADILSPDVNLEYLAERFRLSGGNIKNIALAAAFLAVEERRLVSMEHLLHAIKREYQKMGKVISVEETALPATRQAI